MRVVVAMSGGVDSSVAAALLQEAGHEVVGVHMKLHDAPPPARASAPAVDSACALPAAPPLSPPAAPSGAGHCCGLDDALDARRVAERLGLPFYVMDLREAFERAVIEEFVAAWRRGETPNPCVRCNGVLKFDVLMKRARLLGADALATGHYARVTDGVLRTAADPAKDQSYFLFSVPPASLARTLFPLGGMDKPTVRAHAARLGLVTAEKAESMEVCFLPDDDHARLVAERSPGVEAGGEIVDEAGRVLGRHEGWWRYTVGQRRGLGVAAPEPLYVLRTEPDTRRVVVGPGERLQHHGLVARGCNWFRRPAPGEQTWARIRHRGALVPARVEAVEADTVRLSFAAPARAVTPGQAVVLYGEDAPEGREVWGGGWIGGVG